MIDGDTWGDNFNEPEKLFNQGTQKITAMLQVKYIYINEYSQLLSGTKLQKKVWGLSFGQRIPKRVE